MIYKDTISKEEIDVLPLKSFEGEVVMVNSRAKLDEAVAYLSQFPFLGFDTETKPSFKKGHINKVALLQLSTHEKAYLFRLNQFELPVEIVRLFSDPSILKVGAAIRDDIKALQGKKYFKAEGFIELQDMAKEKGINCFSLKKLSAIHKDHALFACYAPMKSPEIVVAVIAENAGGGGAVAAPIARKILSAYFEGKQNPKAPQIAVNPLPAGVSANGVTPE